MSSELQSLTSTNKEENYNKMGATLKDEG